MSVSEAKQTFVDALNVLPLSEAAKRCLYAAASSWAKAAQDQQEQEGER